LVCERTADRPFFITATCTCLIIIIIIININIIDDRIQQSSPAAAAECRVDYQRFISAITASTKVTTFHQAQNEVSGSTGLLSYYCMSLFCRPNKKKNKNKVNSDMGSVPAPKSSL